MADNKSFKGYQGKIAFRVVLLVFLVFGMIPLFMMAGVLAGEVADGGKRERAEALDSCEYDYYNGEYASLLNTLEAYEETGGEFDRYWEMGKAYEAYQKWKLYDGAAELPDIGEDLVHGYEIRAAQYEEQVRDACASTGDSENRAILEGLIREMEKTQE